MNLSSDRRAFIRGSAVKYAAFASADAAGRATAQQWGRRRERFYTDVRGPVTSSFRAWNPEVGSGARAGEAGETLVPDDEVAMA